MKTTHGKIEPRIKLWPFVAIAIGAAALLCVTGCKYLGADTTAPNAVERQLFNTVTNYVDVPVVKSLTNYVTKEVTLFATNTIGQIVTVTNEVQTPVYTTVTVTNTIPQYENSVNERAKAGARGAAGILNYFFPGSGPMAATGLLAVLAAWAQARSGKRQQTAAALAQQMETVLEFIKTLPNGAAYKEAITGFLKSHQMESGVAEQVLNLIEDKVSNADARAAMEEIKAALTAAQKPA